MHRKLLVLLTLTIFVMGTSCISAAALDIDNNVNKDVKLKTSENSIQKQANLEVPKKTTTKNQLKSKHKADDIINGWNPKEHEVSREDLGDGTTRVVYDDGYFRVIDDEGNILTYGYMG